MHKFYHSFILEYPNAKIAHLSQKRTSDKAGRSVRKRPPPNKLHMIMETKTLKEKDREEKKQETTVAHYFSF